MLTSGQNQLFPSRGYTAETYAKVMGSSSPSQPRIKLKYTLLFCLWIEVDGLVLPPIVYTVSPPLRGGVAFAPRTWVSPPRRRRRTRLVVKHQVKDEDGVPCYTSTRCPTDCLSSRLGQQWRHLPAKGCRVGRREGAAMMPPLGLSPQASEVRGHRCSSSFNITFGTGPRADRRCRLVKQPNLTRTPSCNVCLHAAALASKMRRAGEAVPASSA